MLLLSVVNFIRNLFLLPLSLFDGEFTTIIFEGGKVWVTTLRWKFWWPATCDTIKGGVTHEEWRNIIEGDKREREVTRIEIRYLLLHNLHNIQITTEIRQEESLVGLGLLHR